MPFVVTTEDKISASIKRVVDDVAKGKLHIPEAQRDFIKDQEWIAELVNSIQRGIPIGSLLVWKPDNGTTVATRGGGVIEGRPPLFVMDGLQRLTTLCLMYGVKVDYLTDQRWARLQATMVPEVNIEAMLDGQVGDIAFGNTTVDKPVAWPWLRLPQLLKGDPAVFDSLPDEISSRVAQGQAWATVDEVVTGSDVNDRWVEPIRTAFGSTSQDLDIVRGTLQHATEAAVRRNARGTPFTAAQWARIALANAAEPGFITDHVDPLLNQIGEPSLDADPAVAQQAGAAAALGLSEDDLLLRVHGMATTNDDPTAEPDPDAIERLWRDVGPGLAKLVQLLYDLALPVEANLASDTALVWAALAAERGLLDDDLLRRAVLNPDWRSARSRMLRTNARDAYRIEDPATILATISQEAITPPALYKDGSTDVGLDLLSRSTATSQVRTHGVLLAWSWHLRANAAPDPLTGRSIQEPVFVPLLTKAQVKATELTYQNTRSEKLASEKYVDPDAIVNLLVVDRATAEKLEGMPAARWQDVADVPAAYWNAMGINPSRLIGATPADHRSLLASRRRQLLDDLTVGFAKLDQ